MLKHNLHEAAQRRIDKTAKSIDQETFFGKLEEEQKPVPDTYFYVFGWTKSGRKLIDGPMSLQEADTLLATLEDGEIFEKKTRNQAKATREIKAELLARGEDPDEALRRVLHKIPERK